MANCSTCGAELVPGQNFCGICGTPTTSFTVDATQAGTYYGQGQYPYDTVVSPQTGSRDVFNTPVNQITPPPPPPPYSGPLQAKPLVQKTGSKLWLILLSVLALATLIGGSVIAFTYTNHANEVWMQHVNATATSVSHEATVSAALTATAIAKMNPYDSGRWTLAITDPLTQPHAFINAVTQDNLNECKFAGNSLQVRADKPYWYFPCDSSHSSEYTLANFTLEVHMSILKGDCGGIEFRSAYYLFICSNGYSELDLLGSNQKLTRITTATSGFKNGVNNPHIIGLKAVGNLFQAYVDNQEFLNYAADPNNIVSSAGYLGLLAWDNGDQTTVGYWNLRVWTQV